MESKIDSSENRLSALDRESVDYGNDVLPCNDQQALATALYLIDKLIGGARRKAPKELQVLLLEDFNRHDQL